MSKIKLAIIVPCHNEQSTLNYSFRKIHKELKKLQQELISPDSYILFVDDGSTDNTWSIVKTICHEHSLCKGLRLSFNCGHQHALLAGINEVDADCSISIDADLQDDIKCINNMLKKYMEGSEVVYGIRKKRNKDSFFKKYSALFYYQFMTLLGIKLIHNHADYRLLSQKAMYILKSFKEKHLSLRTIIPSLNLKSSQVYYDRLERKLGESQYNMSKMTTLFVDSMISSNSNIIFFTALISVFSIIFFFLAIFWILYMKLATDQTIIGWASIVLSIFVVGIIQIICQGLSMLYIGRIFSQSKNRPCYHIYEKSNF